LLIIQTKKGNIVNIQEIARKLHQIVQEAEDKAATENGAQWKEKYQWLESELLSIKEQAEALHEDMKANGLTVGSIESEGYLRCAVTVCNLVERINDSYKSED
jgi:hypothetical protein